jgi:hypothetical protein
MNFEQLGIEEKKLLLRAYNYDVDQDGIIIDRLLNEPVFAADTQRVVTLENASLIPGSLKIIDTTPLTISKLLRELSKPHSEKN